MDGDEPPLAVPVPNSGLRWGANTSSPAPKPPSPQSHSLSLRHMDSAGSDGEGLGKEEGGAVPITLITGALGAGEAHACWGTAAVGLGAAGGPWGRARACAAPRRCQHQHAPILHAPHALHPPHATHACMRAGKTTLVRHLLTANHGLRVAVILNEVRARGTHARAHQRHAGPAGLARTAPCPWAARNVCPASASQTQPACSRCRLQRTAHRPPRQCW